MKGTIKHVSPRINYFSHFNGVTTKQDVSLVILTWIIGGKHHDTFCGFILKYLFLLGKFAYGMNKWLSD